MIALFREPRRRAVSAWNHGKHTHHLGTADANSHYPNSRERFEEETPTLEHFSRHMHVVACQTKMLIGGQCGMHHNFTNASLAEARRRLNNLAFVGLTDHYNASVCLFHSMWGGEIAPYMFQNARPGKMHSDRPPRKLPGGGFQERPSAWSRLSEEDDPIDQATFRAARTLFVKRLAEAGLI